MHIAARACVVALVLLTPAAALRAQDVPNREAAVEYRKQFMTDLDTLHSKVMALAGAIPAEKYAWRPGEGVRSFGEVLMHIASEYYVFNPMSFGGERSPLLPRGPDVFKKFEANASKDSVLKYLRNGYAYSRSTIMAIDPANLTGTRKLFGRDFTIIETGTGMTADLHEHLGQLIAYARMNGIAPPWSK